MTDGALPNDLCEFEEKRIKRARKRNERNYLRAVISRITDDDIEKVAEAVVKDAINGDEKCRNAAREWLGKYVLGGGNVRPSDVEAPPVVRKSR